MEKYHGPRTATAAEAQHLELPEQVQLAIDDLAGKLREGLLALSVGVGLKVMDELLEEELVGLCGPKGNHDPERTARRHGSRRSSVVLGGRKVNARRTASRCGASPPLQAPLERRFHAHPREAISARSQARVHRRFDAHAVPAREFLRERLEKHRKRESLRAHGGIVRMA